MQYIKLYIFHFSLGEKAVVHLVQRLPTGDEEKPRLVQDPTVASLLCAIFQLTNKNDKNAKLVLYILCFFCLWVLFCLWVSSYMTTSLIQKKIKIKPRIKLNYNIYIFFRIRTIFIEVYH